MPIDPARTPVIASVAQVTERDALIDNQALAVRVATDALHAAPGLAGSIQRLTAVGALLAPGSPTMAGDLAAALAIDPAQREVTTTGGHTPQWLVNRAAADIAAGSLDATLIVGAEAARSHRASRGDTGTPFNAGRRITTDAADPVVGSPDRGMLSSAEHNAGLVMPTTVYPTLESALVADAGRTFAEHRAHLATIMARLTEVAATNPYAWFPTAASADELASTAGGNRLTAEPYTKRMNAFPYVDQAAALVVCSLEVARAAGLGDDVVFVWSGAEANDVILPGARPFLGRSQGAEAALAAAFGAAGIDADDVAAFDLYSCFPVALEMGARAAGISVDDPRALSATGGLPYFGGPGNNYTTHGIATMVERLRHDGGIGVCTGLGGYATKHAGGVYADRPATNGFRRGDTTEHQAAIDAGAVPLATTVAAGTTATVEANTVVYAADGTVAAAPVIARLGDGRRICARARPSALPDLAGQLLVDRRVRILPDDGSITYEVDG